MNNLSRPTARFALVCGLCLAAFAGPAPAQSIVTSKHNLSLTGPGPVRSLTESRICVFCHTPHGASGEAALWNRSSSGAAYLPYDSPTLKALVGQPTGASKLCLSCHDGTIALGDLLSVDTPIAMTGTGLMPPGGGLIGTDLRNDHPISFNYFESLALGEGELTSPASWDPEVELDPASELQCTTCHDAHVDTWGDFLVMDNQQSALCRQCHNLPVFDQTPHADSPRTWSGAGLDPWPHTEYSDVRTNACMNCHRTHHADGAEHLLSDIREEETCFVCHGGNVASADIESVFNKAWTHPVEQSFGIHQANESPLVTSAHVECADCHDPHRARDATAQAPFVPGALEGTSGVDATGAPVAEAVFEYQVCLKCHGETAVTPGRVIDRDVPSINTAREFSPSSPSFHPVEVAGRGMDVPSLISPLTTGSLIYCTDCHGNDSSGGGAGGLAGPHGSNFEFLLTRRYETGDPIAESPAAYDLCYGCHSRSNILDDVSFERHRKHIVGEDTACSVCHDPHGIDFGQGNATNHAHLINFDLSVVDPDPETGRLEYRTLGPRSGECFLSCHGEDHSPESY